MRKFFTWTYMLFKRTLMNPVFIIVSLLLPFISFGIKLTADSASVYMDIAIYSPDEDTFTTDILDGLLQRDGIFRFTRCDSIEEVYELTAAGKTSCGYIFPENLEGMLGGYILGIPPINIITVVAPPDSSTELLTNEIVYAAIIESYAYSLLVEDTSSYEIFDHLDEDFMKDKLYTYYRTYLESDETFSFVSSTDVNASSININIYDYITTPIRSLSAITIFLAALCGGFVWHRDKEKGTFSLLHKKARLFLGFSDILIPTIVTSTMSMITLFALGISHELLPELLAMLIYVLFTSIFVFIFKSLIRNIHVYTGTIPVFILGCFAFCPVLINLASFSPVFRYIQLMFVPNYYLRALNLFL